MVLRGEMTTTTTTRTPERERPKNLHNFTLPNLRWGSQRHFRCMRIDGSTGSGSGSGDHRRLRRRSPPLRFAGSSAPIHEPEHRSRDGNNNQHRQAPLESWENGGEEEEEEEGIEEFRVKIMSDLKTVRDKITQSMYALKERNEEEERKLGGQEKEGEVSPAKPWNLRKRRAAACKESVEERRANSSPPPPRNDSTRGGVAVVEAETTATRAKFSLKLSKKEIEEDFMAALGCRPPRRPKKRPRAVQKTLDSLHPGFYLTEVTLDAYKVPEDTKNMQR